MKLKRGFFGHLFYNNKFVMAFSVVAALILWVSLAFNDTETNPRAITDVPVTLKLSDSAQADGLRIFSPTEIKVRVMVRGNSITVNSLTADDLTVEPQAAQSIAGPGKFPTTLVAKKNSNLTAFEVVSIEPSTIILSVDYYTEKTFPVNTDDITGQAADGYYTAGPVSSLDSVTVSGPKTVVDNIARVAAEKFEAGYGLTKTVQFTSNLVLYDANSNKISSDKISPNSVKLSASSVDVTISVLARKSVPLVASFTNQPSGLTLGSARVSVDPAEIDLAASEDILSGVTEINLPPIDFSAISPVNNVFDLDVTVPTNLKNLASLTKARVRVDLSGFGTRTLVVNNFQPKNVPTGYDPEVLTKSLTVTIVGPEDEIAALTDTNLTALVDMAGKDNITGHTEVPATITISGANSSWAFGQYKAVISLEKKTT